MELMEAILTRRSVRSYNNKPVSQSTIEQLLRAAMQAPSAKNTQPWQFVVINQTQLLDQIPDFHPFAKMIPGAALAILICADKTIQSNQSRWCQDLGAATQNLLLAAHSLGLGAVWLGIFGTAERERGIIDLLKLPDHIHPYALISIGYSDEIPQPINRYKPERVHFNQWIGEQDD